MLKYFFPFFIKLGPLYLQLIVRVVNLILYLAYHYIIYRNIQDFKEKNYLALLIIHVYDYFLISKSDNEMC